MNDTQNPTQAGKPKPKKKNPRKPRSGALVFHVERSPLALDEIPQYDGEELAEKEAYLGKLKRDAEAARLAAEEARREMIMYSLTLAASNREWGHVSKTARTIDMSRTQFVRLFEKRHPGALALVAPEKGRKQGYAGVRANTTDDVTAEESGGDVE